MRYTLVATLLFALLFTACTTQNKNAELTGKWQAVDMDAPDVERAMNDQMNFLDTMGDNTTPEQNAEIYGVEDVKQIRDSLKDVLLEYVNVQEEALKHTSFEFKDNGTFVRTLNSHVDSGKWEINDAGTLVISEVKEEMAHLKMNLLSLSDTLLKLQMEEDGMASTVIFTRIDN